MGSLKTVHAAYGSPPVHATNLSSSWASPPMMGFAGWWDTAGTPDPVDVMLVVAAYGVGLPKSTSRDEAASPSSMGSEGNKRDLELLDFVVVEQCGTLGLCSRKRSSWAL